MSLDYQDIGGSGIGVAAAFSDSSRTSDQKALQYGKGDKATARPPQSNMTPTGLSGAMYADTRNMTPISVNGTSGFANKTQNFEVVAQYQFENGLRPSLAYVQSKARILKGLAMSIW